MWPSAVRSASRSALESYFRDVSGTCQRHSPGLVYLEKIIIQNCEVHLEILQELLCMCERVRSCKSKSFITTVIELKEETYKISRRDIRQKLRTFWVLYHFPRLFPITNDDRYCLNFPSSRIGRGEETWRLLQRRYRNSHLHVFSWKTVSNQDWIDKRATHLK